MLRLTPSWSPFWTCQTKVFILSRAFGTVSFYGWTYQSSIAFQNYELGYNIFDCFFWMRGSTNIIYLKSAKTSGSCSSRSWDCTWSWTWPASRCTSKSPSGWSLERWWKLWFMVVYSGSYKQMCRHNIVSFRIIWQLQQIYSFHCNNLWKWIGSNLNVVAVVDCWVEVGKDEVGVVGKPADQEQRHNAHHHFHNLK